jgi:hypothetical protein
VISGDYTTYNFYGQELHWVYVASTLLFSHLAVYSIVVYLCKIVFELELADIARVFRAIEPEIPNDVVMDEDQWSTLNTRFLNQRRVTARIILDTVAIFCFLSSFMFYLSLFHGF